MEAEKEEYKRLWGGEHANLKVFSWFWEHILWLSEQEAEESHQVLTESWDKGLEPVGSEQCVQAVFL